MKKLKKLKKYGVEVVAREYANYEDLQEEQVLNQYSHYESVFAHNEQEAVKRAFKRLRQYYKVIKEPTACGSYFTWWLKRIANFDDLMEWNFIVY